MVVVLVDVWLIEAVYECGEDLIGAGCEKLFVGACASFGYFMY